VSGHSPPGPKLFRTEAPSRLTADNIPSDKSSRPSPKQHKLLSRAVAILANAESKFLTTCRNYCIDQNLPPSLRLLWVEQQKCFFARDAESLSQNVPRHWWVEIHANDFMCNVISNDFTTCIIVTPTKKKMSFAFLSIFTLMICIENLYFTTVCRSVWIMTEVHALSHANLGVGCIAGHSNGVAVTGNCCLRFSVILLWSPSSYNESARLLYFMLFSHNIFFDGCQLPTVSKRTWFGFIPKRKCTCLGL